MASENVTTATAQQTTASHELFLALGLCEIFISFLGSTGNLLTCFAVVRNKNLHHATNFYVLSLAMADFLVTSILVPVRAAEHLAIFNDSIPPSKKVIDVAVFIGRATILCSLASLSALSIDRYLALKYPIIYRVRIRYNFKRTLIIVAFLWIISWLLTTIPMFPGVSPFQGLIVFAVFVFIMTLIIFITSWKVLQLVKQLFKRLKKFRSTKSTTEDASFKRHISFAKYSIFRNINKIERSVGIRMDGVEQCFEHKTLSRGGRGGLAFDNDAFYIGHKQQPVKLLGVTRTDSENHKNFSVCRQFEIRSYPKTDSRETALHKDINAPAVMQGKPVLAANSNGTLAGVSSMADGYIAKTIAIITCAFVVCVYPRIVLILYHVAVKENQETRVWRLWLKVLLYINSIVNPFLYAWRFRDFRREFFYLIRKLKRTIC